ASGDRDGVVRLWRAPPLARVEALPHARPPGCPGRSAHLFALDREGTDVGREELQRRPRRPPLRPFRVVLCDGRQYAIQHPRMNLLARTYVKIGIPAADLPPPTCDHTEYVPLAQIERVEDLSVDGASPAS